MQLEPSHYWSAIFIFMVYPPFLWIDCEPAMITLASLNHTYYHWSYHFTGHTSLFWSHEVWQHLNASRIPESPCRFSTRPPLLTFDLWLLSAIFLSVCENEKPQVGIGFALFHRFNVNMFWLSLQVYPRLHLISSDPGAETGDIWGLGVCFCPERVFALPHVGCMCREPAQAELGAGALRHSVSHHEVLLLRVKHSMKRECQELKSSYFVCEASWQLLCLSSQLYVSVGDCHGLPGGSEHMGALQETRVGGIQLHVGDWEAF